MARTIGIAMACDLLREDLDASAWCAQRMCNRVLAEAAERTAVVCLLRHGQAAALPEFLEGWRREALRGERSTGRLIEMRQPLASCPPFRKGFAGPEALGEIGKDIVVVAREAERLGDPVHGNQQRIIGGIADVLALERHRRGQDDVGMA